LWKIFPIRAERLTNKKARKKGTQSAKKAEQENALSILQN
jgi:hypothetical protein